MVEGIPDGELAGDLSIPENVYKFSQDAASISNTRLSFIGQYANKWRCNEGKTPISKSSPTINNLTAKKAKPYILSRTKNEQVVFINEFPDHPQNRMFLLSMLAELLEQGFHHIGFESYDGKDKVLQKRRYPVLNTGYYTKEPVFGTLMKSALDLGFNFVVFEPNDQQFSKAKSILQRKGEFYEDEDRLNQSAQNWSRAMNLTNFFRTQPEAKVIIFTSTTSIKELPFNGSKPMAAWFESFSKIDPLTIDQATMTEKCVEDENPIMYARKNFRASRFTKSQRSFCSKRTRSHYR